MCNFHMLNFIAVEQNLGNFPVAPALFDTIVTCRISVEGFMQVQLCDIH